LSDVAFWNVRLNAKRGLRRVIQKTLFVRKHRRETLTFWSWAVAASELFKGKKKKKTMYY
jgi:hypothetical protein